MATKEKYRLLLNLGFLGFIISLSLFDIAIGQQDFFNSKYKKKPYNIYFGSLSSNSNSRILEKSKEKNKEQVFLTVNVFSDKQYNYDQNIFLAEGNVKALINGGILRSELLSYEKSTSILSASGNVRFKKGGQYFRAKEFSFNLLTKEGFIKDTYGILDIKNVLNDLNLDSKSNNILVRQTLADIEKITFDDGIQYTLGNIKFPKNKITRSNNLVGSINNWRFKSDLITINQNGWKADKINFTNDPLDPNQISFEGIDVIAEEDQNQLFITSSKTNLILDGRTKIFLGNRIFGDDTKKENKFELNFDSKDRDGIVLIRKSNSTNIFNDKIKLDFQPQFLINRALLGETNSYLNMGSQDNKAINFLDLFGLNLKLYSTYKGWKFDSVNDLSTLNINRISNAIRHSSSLRKYFKMPFIDDSSLNIFTAYRSRIWNGTIGETEINSAYGGYIENTKSFQYGRLKNNLNFGFGLAKYEAERLRSTKINSLWRSNVFSSLDTKYQIWRRNQKNLEPNKKMLLSSMLVNPELVLRTNINSGYFKYEEGSDQGFLKFSIGPEIRLGKLERDFLDYTKLSVMPGVKIKVGNSPFKFDNVIDLKTLNISLIQQIYGPLLFDVVSNINIDDNSKSYGKYYDTKLGILWQKRAYEFAIYYHPDNFSGGIYFRINGFNFDNSVKAIF